MHRIDGAGATVDNKFTQGNPGAGTPATVVTADWLNDVQENIFAVLVAGSITATKNRAADLKDAIAAMIAAAAGTVPDASETVKGKAELATVAEVQAGSDTTRIVTPAGLAARTATETRTGIVELATTAEAIAGVDTTRAVTPAGLKAAIDAALASFTPTDGFEAGDMIVSGRSSKTGRWLLCQGAAVSRTTYADLFAQFGTAFGAGNGSTTFNLPDARGRALIGAGQGAGLSNYPMGSRSGSETSSYSIPLPEHRHGSGANKKEADNNVYGGTKPGTPSTSESMAGDPTSTTGWWTEYAGEAGASITVDRRQPYLAAGNLFARY